MWNASEDKLLCFMLVDDAYASKLSPRAAEAFWRGFIVQNRKTGLVHALIRWHYTTATPGQTERKWSNFAPNTQQNVDMAVAELRCGIEDMLRKGAEAIGVHLPPEAIICFYPPDDEGDYKRTIIWLEAKNLIGFRERGTDEPGSSKPSN